MNFLKQHGFLDLTQDSRGAVLVEFAMLLPFIFAMIIGVIQMGLQMHGYNAVRSVAAETARYVIIQYQNRTLVSMNQITDKAEAIATNAPYGLDLNNIQVTVTDPASGIAGTKKFSIQIDLPRVISSSCD